MVNLSLVKKSISVPIPSSINYFWNFGSLLGFNLIIQIVSGLFLAFNYEASVESSFDSVVHIMSDVGNGWLFRFIHANGASFFFVLIYCHIARGMYYGSFKSKYVWLVGVTVLLVSMATAFLGYVLPWGQISLWGATVITNLLSAIPYVGVEITVWLWGGFSVGTPTLTRFFSLHFILPFVILVLVVFHLLALHEKGSNNPLGLSEQSDNVSFHPYFTYNDVVGVVIFVSVLAFIVLISPDLFIDPDNFSMANPMVTPVHIQPEWYFLFAYAILRSIPSNLGGVIGLVSSIAIMYLCVLKNGNSSSRYSNSNKVLVTLIFIDFFLLTWVGAMPAASPLVDLGNILSVLYFMSMLVWLVL